MLDGFTLVVVETRYRGASRFAKAADTITSFADPERFDLVIMGTRGLSAIEQLPKWVERAPFARFVLRPSLGERGGRG